MGEPLSAEDVRRGLMSGELVLIGCRWAGHPNPPPGTKRGYLCLNCGKELEATPAGQVQIEAGGKPICIPCATAWAEYAADTGRLGGISIGPHAEASMASGRGVPEGERLDLLRMAHPYRRPK
jgi:DNA-directed RNA polymerase subunit RPC12/RpoP